MITRFANEHSFLSNFHPNPIKFNGEWWETSEHIYQSEKTFLEKEKEKIRCAKTPGQAKKLGSKVKLRDDWDEAKITIMRAIIQLKFDQHPDLVEKLIKTKDQILVEGNRWHDNFWGSCYCDKCIKTPGKNHLGKILMEVRDDKRQSC